MLIYTFILFICKLFLFYYLYIYLFNSLNIVKNDANGVSNTFKIFIEKIKLERLRKCNTFQGKCAYKKHNRNKNTINISAIKIHIYISTFAHENQGNEIFH